MAFAVAVLPLRDDVLWLRRLRVVAEVVVNSATTAAAGHLRLAVALEAREPGLAVQVFIAIALTFATLLASRAAGTALVDESACCACTNLPTMTTLLSVSYTIQNSVSS